MRRWMMVAALALVLTAPCRGGNTSIIEDSTDGVQGKAADLLSSSTGVMTANTTVTSPVVRTKSSLSIVVHYHIDPPLSAGQSIRVIPVYSEGTNPLDSEYVPAKDDDSQTIASTDCQKCMLNFVPPMSVHSVKFQFVPTANSTMTARGSSK